ncbi:MAG: C13 family peptidase [Gammaproteobacteria bacterium]|jgi:hypothetical protein
MKTVLILLILSASLAAGAGAAPSDGLFAQAGSGVPVAAQTAHSTTRWHVVLAAVGNEQNVFDNFVSDFAQVLKGHSDIASFTELHASADKRWLASGLQGLERSLAMLSPQEGEGCLVYLTGHGSPDGIAMSADTPQYFVRPSRLESMLNPCAGRPTILVVSACFSGTYMRPGITREERIVMSASAANLPSFGCSNNLHYTFFDQCFIDAWPRHNNWGLLADDVRTCVNSTERTNNFPSSKPQVFFGPHMRDLALPALEASQDPATGRVF